MNLIAAVAHDWGIGYQGKLLFSNKDDMRYFTAVTTGKVVVMGRATLESFPGGKPLKNRVNIVLSSRPDFEPEGVIVCRNLDELFSVLAPYPTDDVFVIGGEMVYTELLNVCRTAYITKVQACRQADCYFPNLDVLPMWECIETSAENVYNDLHYTFCRYENKGITA